MRCTSVVTMKTKSPLGSFVELLAGLAEQDQSPPDETGDNAQPV